MEKGTVLTEKHLAVKVAEPKGLCGSFYQEVLGRKVRRDLEKDDRLMEEDLE